MSFWVYGDDINTLGESVHTIKKNTEASVVASREPSLEVDAEKTEYMAVSRNKNAGQNHKIKTGNTISERVKHFSVWEQP